MFGFKRRREEEIKARNDALLEELSKLPCERRNGKHLYRDFPATISWKTGRNGFIEINEAYVCVYCGHRETRTLQHVTYDNLSNSELQEEVKRIETEYKDLIKPKPIVEDMIEDARMLDRRKLQAWDSIHSLTPKPEETEEQRLKRYGEELFGLPKVVAY